MLEFQIINYSAICYYPNDSKTYLQLLQHLLQNHKIILQKFPPFGQIDRSNQEFGFSIIDAAIVQPLIAIGVLPFFRGAYEERNYLSVGACIVLQMEGLRVSLHDEESTSRGKEKSLISIRRGTTAEF